MHYDTGVYSASCKENIAVDKVVYLKQCLRWTYKN